MTKAEDYNLKSIKEQFKNAGVFYTPPELAEWLKSLLPLNPKSVYDPTCGRGALLSVFDDSVEKYGQDIDSRAVEDASKYLVNFHGAAGDVLADSKFADRRFDAIVANPPFSVKWEPRTDDYFALAPTVPTQSKADFAFLIHILHMLSDEGTAAVINFPGIAYRGGREQTIRKWMIENNWVDTVIHIAGNTFTDTAISTICLVLKKNRTSQTVRFVDRENELEREVPLSEIAEKDFTLSVSSYVQPERIVEVVDPVELEKSARRNAIRKLRNEIEFSRMVAKLEGWHWGDFIDELQNVLDEYKNKNV
jgi:type I restriction enzyme M protein